MNKGISTTTVGAAALLATMMFQSRPPRYSDAGKDKSRDVSLAAKSVPKDGPWLASCNYWSAAKVVHLAKQANASPAGVTIAQEEGVKLQLRAPEDKATCGPADWNIPQGGPHDPEISAIIATIPDPIHSHLALDFDRSIDAILLAAADNQYLSSYYWLPWRNQVSSSSTGESTSSATSATEQDNTRELQPGLIILRYAPDVSEWQDQNKNKNEVEWANYRRVIYLFLVAETPALGVNGNQLQNAFGYEKILKNCYKATLSIRWNRQSDATAKPPDPLRCINQQANAVPNHPPFAAAKAERKTGGRPDTASPDSQISIIGPFYSGSASSLHAGIEAALPELHESRVSITGVTGTLVAAHELDPENKGIYRSFGENIAFEQGQFLHSLTAMGYKLNRVAVLSEAGTVFGSNSKASEKPPSPESDQQMILYLHFPRELSLLRNAEAGLSSKPDPIAPPTPYLNLSLKDYAADNDTVPRFSTTQSPLSIEAQLMAIAHQLRRARSQFIIISASNVLDDIFLAQFLHRACPDARLVILSGGDLLFERDGEDAPYVGSISISPYLLSSLDFGSRVQWLHADYQGEAVYNAASFTFHNSESNEPPILAGYRSYPVPSGDRHLTPVEFQQIPLWAAVIGADGYYPLAVLNWCGSDSDAILPTISPGNSKPPRCTAANVRLPDQNAPDPRSSWNSVPESISQNSGISPSLLWGVLACFISLGCLGHCILLLTADFWSPFTRDLAIDCNDLPYRRAVHINIGTSVLAAMAFVMACPLLRVWHYFPVAPMGLVLAVTMLAAAVSACICTGLKTWRYFYHPKGRIYTFFNSVSLIALAGIIGLWSRICASDNLGGLHSYAGLYFSYRCLQPLSGVSPLVPVLLLLFAWYLWAIYQTARLRFSQVHRPRLARRPTPNGPYLPSTNASLLYVPDETLESCNRSSDNCLYQNITCLLITREVIRRFFPQSESDSQTLSGSRDWVDRPIDIVLACIYLGLFVLCILFSHVHSIDRFLLAGFPAVWGPTAYELLVTALFFPLIMVALSGWLRVIFIWGALSRGLLEPLERMPIRFAFSRYRGGSWMSMLRQKGLHIRWRDMGRSTESIRQILHHPDLKEKPTLSLQLSGQYMVINARIHELLKGMPRAGIQDPAATQPMTAGVKTPVSAEIQVRKAEGPCPSDCLWDVPTASADLCSIFRIEQGYARFCSLLLEGLLVPWWDRERTGFVEEGGLTKEEDKDKSKESGPSEPSLIQLAEELIVVRYVALIRAVLINIRYQMLLVATTFVLALIAWNSYPFQPHALIDWCFTLLLATLSLGFIWVFAQMHRNAILSRITHTTANELGWEFYLRVATFGAVPVLTWLAYQFPAIGGSLYKIIQPGLQVAK